MVKLYENGAYLVNGSEIVPDGADAGKILASRFGISGAEAELAS